MWNAIKSDVYEFFTVIKSDVGQAIDEMQVKASGEAQALTDLRNENNTKALDDIANNLSTFSEEVHHHEYPLFREKFNLDDHASEIAIILDENSGFETSNFFASLVPEIISAEEFWCRVLQYTKGKFFSSPSAADITIADEEENIPWDEPEAQVEQAHDKVNNSRSIEDLPGQVICEKDVFIEKILKENKQLRDENEILKSKLRLLEAPKLVPCSAETNVSEASEGLSCKIDLLAEDLDKDDDMVIIKRNES